MSTQSIAHENILRDKEVFAKTVREMFEYKNLLLAVYGEILSIGVVNTFRIVNNDLRIFTANALFDYCQQLHHDADVYTLIKKKLYIDYEDCFNSSDALEKLSNLKPFRNKRYKCTSKNIPI